MAFPWCVMLVPEVPGRSKAALLLEAKWEPPGRMISISFLDGDGRLWERVRAVAETWLTRTSANLIFQWRKNTTATNIRISFRYRGSWSLLGNHALEEHDVERPTMNFGLLRPDSTDLEVQEVVLHEFGHALGLVHEHSSPEANIPWNEDAVIEELSGPPNHWSLDVIRRNVFEGYDRSAVRATPFDRRSIMLYPIKKAWTTDGTETANNTDLSAGDIELIRTIYG